MRILLVVLSTLFINTLLAQNENVSSFDKIIGIENTVLYNGKVYTNPYIISNEQHNFYNQPNYNLGTVRYDSQNFYSINLKYDIIEDKLIFQPSGDKNYLNIELLKSKVENFTIGEKLFINTQFLDLEKQSKNIELGFVEVQYQSNQLKFLIKHSKNSKEIIDNNRLKTVFKKYTEYYLYYNKSILEITSISQLKKLWPEKKNIISDFNKTYSKLKKENKIQFYTNLLHAISND